MLLFNQRFNLLLFFIPSLQYIPCYYSTHQFQYHFLYRKNFNTSHVIIQPTKNRHSCILLISINHDFKPFLSYFTNHSIENQLFVRNHVFTPFDRLFQKITWEIFLTKNDIFIFCFINSYF
jgi:hypothetical protein